MTGSGCRVRLPEGVPALFLGSTAVLAPGCHESASPDLTAEVDALARLDELPAIVRHKMDEHEKWR